MKSDKVRMVTLMSRDVPVVRFGYDARTACAFAMDAVQNAAFAPVGCTDPAGSVTRNRLGRWVSLRGIPRERDGFDETFRELGYDSSDSLLLANLGLSLSDQYWLRPDDCELRWEDVNFFTNDFDERLGRVIAARHPSSAAHALLRDGASGLSPDAATHGTLKKRWSIEDDGTRVLIKAGRLASLNQEPYDEAVATALCRRLLAPDEYVPYEVRLADDGEGGQAPVCVCPTMADELRGFEPFFGMRDLVPRRNDRSPYDNAACLFEERGIENARRQLQKMIVVDYLIENSDRHHNNFGVMVDATTHAWVGMAPLFDFGSSLWHTFGDATALPPCRSSVQRLPFLHEPDEQLKYVTDLGWLEPGMLDGFADEAVDLLAQDAMLVALAPRRLEATRAELTRRVGRIEALAT